MNWLISGVQNQAFAWGLNHIVIPALAPLTFLVIQWAKQGQGIVDSLPKAAKIALAPIISTLVAALAAFSGQDLACSATATCTLADITPVLLTGTLSGAGAWLLHYLKNRPAPPTNPAN